MRETFSLQTFLSRKRLGLAILVGLLCATIAFVVIATTAPRSLARMDFLIVQNTQTSDFYALFKSSEFLSEILVDAVHTERFIERVALTPAGTTLQLPEDKKKRLEAWRKMVDVSQRHKLGRLEIVVYGDDPRSTQVIANGVADVLIQQNSAFRGGAQEDVGVRLLTGPVLENNPSLRSIATALGTSFLFGFFAVLVATYVRMERGISSVVQRPLHAPQSVRKVVSFDDEAPQSQMDTAQQWDESFNAIAQKLQRLKNTDTERSES